MLIENTNELAQNKLLLLYIIEKSTINLSNDEITNFLLEKNYINYFLIQQYLSELVEENFIDNIEKDEKKVYIILNKGRISLEFFIDRIPPSIREDIDNRFAEINKEAIKSEQIIGEYFKKDRNRYIVNFKLVENKEILFSLYLNVSTEEDAKKFVETWKNNTEKIYKNVLNILADDNITSI